MRTRETILDSRREEAGLELQAAGRRLTSEPMTRQQVVKSAASAAAALLALLVALNDAAPEQP